MKLEGRTVLITGGTSGIGLELAGQLLRRGNTVVVTGRDQERLAVAARTLPGVHTLRSDVSDPDAIRTLHARVLDEFPALDTLVNNAGIMRNLNLQEERDLGDVTREIETGLSGPVWMIQQFLPHLRTRPGALIVNVSSGLAFIPMAISPIYSAAKAGLHAYSQALRAQLTGSGSRWSNWLHPRSRRRCSGANSGPRPGGRGGWTWRCWCGGPWPGSRRESWRFVPA